MTKTAKILIIMILPLLAILFYISTQFFINDLPAAVRGRLDLSSWDFNQDGSVALNGEWECYDGQLLTPEDFSGTAASKPNLTGYTHLTISRLAKSEQETLEPKGIRTYRLLIKIKSSEEPFGLKIDNIRMSNKLYVNGIMKGSCGNPAEKGHGYVPKNASYNAYFDVPGD
jgi:two-component system sensor histidine kinase ChiS